MLTKEICQKIVLSSLAKENLVEMSSGEGQKFCNALGEAMFNIVSKMDTVFQVHTHVCAAPTTPSAAPVPPSLFMDPEPEV